MTVSWPVLICTLLVLFFPTRLFTRKRVWRRLDHPPQDETGRVRWWWATPGLVIDVACGAGGTLLLHGYAFEAEPRAIGFSAVAPSLTAYGLLAAAVVYRLPVWGGPRVCAAPVAFMAGILWAVLPPMAAGTATVLALCTALALRSLAGAFIAAAIAVMAAGLLFKAPRFDLVMVATLSFLPVVISLLSFRTLALASRR